ncbi:MAG: hypothetical protein HY821_06035 [Acidobacteria bacterium]|nr:hypothetical protein [Acidobacteriota bacterium]
MSERYLWDGTGEPDAEIAHLEELLRPLGLPAAAVPARKKAWMPLAAAAAVLVALAGWQVRVAAPPETRWETAQGFVHAGQVLRAGAEEVQLDAAEVGRVSLQPGAEAAVLESKPGQERLGLRVGTMRALIWAPAREFVVETPAATAVDLGCQYTLTVDRTGDGLLEVETGWVSFEHQGRESFIPAGARCRTRRVGGPGTPYFADAPAALERALNEFDERGGGLEQALSSARGRDALSLWHLLPRTAGERRAAVYRRLAQLVALPKEATEERILASDARALEQCWNALGLDSAAWWRSWQRPW